MQRLFPSRFRAPDADELGALAPGDSVKICVTEARELFWTSVISVSNGVIRAAVDNRLVHLDWPVGKPLAFNPYPTTEV